MQVHYITPASLIGGSNDQPAKLWEVGLQLARCYRIEESRALRRLLTAEAARFPDLLDIVDEVPRRVMRALADRLGTRPIPDTELPAITDAAAAHLAVGTPGLFTPSRRTGGPRVCIPTFLEPGFSPDLDAVARWPTRTGMATRSSPATPSPSAVAWTPNW
ncbi:TetR/AcrR family transcriptional regulator C-terminal domain-containing protein [Nocardia sp. KC 131]|uniref:TetR/AcrR family transcriptional regulator C-terminal domain-containing protein n=1 Tax=Nocardia arseniciresistens TaxID=3392119 RepID=UPI00398EC467